MQTEKKTIKWRNGNVAEEYNVVAYDYKGESKCTRVGLCKKFDMDGTLKEESVFEITTYHDREGRSFYGPCQETRKIYENGRLSDTEIWVPEYSSPFNGPESLHSFILKERTPVNETL